jgi:hypothetical protein
MGPLCSREIRTSMPSPAEGVRALEEVYLKKYRKFTGSPKGKPDGVKQRRAERLGGLKGFLARLIRKPCR